VVERSMAQVEVAWQGGLRFDTTDSYGHAVTVDAPAEEGDSFQGMVPEQMLLTSLAACSGIDVATILQRQNQKVTGVAVRMEGVQLPDAPWTWVEINLAYMITGDGIDRAAIERTIHLSETKYCSVGTRLAGRAKIRSTFEIREEATGF